MEKIKQMITVKTRGKAFILDGLKYGGFNIVSPMFPNSFVFKKIMYGFILRFNE